MPYHPACSALIVMIFVLSAVLLCTIPTAQRRRALSSLRGAHPILHSDINNRTKREWRVGRRIVCTLYHPVDWSVSAVMLSWTTPTQLTKRHPGHPGGNSSWTTISQPFYRRHSRHDPNSCSRTKQAPWRRFSGEWLNFNGNCIGIGWVWA